MGPEGGERGGQVIAEGSPEQVTAVEASHTGAFLRDVLCTGKADMARGRSRLSEP
jgi:excinuclease ABC subunit A